MTEQQILRPGDSVCIDAVVINRAGDQNELRRFHADLHLDDGTTTEVQMGSIGGLVGWQFRSDCLWDAAEKVSADAEPLGRAAEEIIAWIEDATPAVIAAVVMVEMVRLEPQFRRQRLGTRIIAELLDVLALDPTETLIVLQPEPQREEGGPLAAGPERDDAVARLRRGYEDQGLERWRETQVYWELAGE